MDSELLQGKGPSCVRTRVIVFVLVRMSMRKTASLQLDLVSVSLCCQQFYHTPQVNRLKEEYARMQQAGVQPPLQAKVCLTLYCGALGRLFSSVS